MVMAARRVPKRAGFCCRSVSVDQGDLVRQTTNATSEGSILKTGWLRNDRLWRMLLQKSAATDWGRWPFVKSRGFARPDAVYCS